MRSRTTDGGSASATQSPKSPSLLVSQLITLYRTPLIYLLLAKLRRRGQGAACMKMTAR
ncbi:hypothetical protein BN77_p10704 [Rhizobium mesoamericanum STM3625]|uniref:Uncharacterized protein n=1 Tax=Rhizobium mesoamericanum STM3625 TaxID=1211777 RepID=K0PRU5_9HYPH|nr:hypothetical protein BN77_p10704 [Rhizobium mesoamericanum STM3625]